MTCYHCGSRFILTDDPVRCFMCGRTQTLLTPLDPTPLVDAGHIDTDLRNLIKRRSRTAWARKLAKAPQ